MMEILTLMTWRRNGVDGCLLKTAGVVLSEPEISWNFLDQATQHHYNLTMEDLLKSIDSNIELKRFLEKLSARPCKKW